jgi:ABC-type spermidine/putrescine transport system permease subunit I
MGLFWKSVRMSLIVSVSAVVMAYPVAYFLALVAGRKKYSLLLLTIGPFLTSYLLRVLAWRVILGEQGLINSFLKTAGAIGPDEGIRWLFYSQWSRASVRLKGSKTFDRLSDQGLCIIARWSSRSATSSFG